MSGTTTEGNNRVNPIDTVKRDYCLVCNKVVYPMDKVAADDKVFHKTCLRCGHCNKVLSLGTYAALNGVFYCKPHFKQLFALKGNYSDGFKASEEAASSKSSEPVVSPAPPARVATYTYGATHGNSHNVQNNGDAQPAESLQDKIKSLRVTGNQVTEEENEQEKQNEKQVKEQELADLCDELKQVEERVIYLKRTIEEKQKEIKNL